MIEHEFTSTIIQSLQSFFGEVGERILENSPLLQYLNLKTRAASRGSKSRGNYANLYAIYVLVEDYIYNGYEGREDYDSYDGARFTDLLNRQRKLPFGAKLQNHALNGRVNDEFKGVFSQVEEIPIIRDMDTNRYWINENLLKVSVDTEKLNIAQAIIFIIDQYIIARQNSFESFIETCEKLQTISDENDSSVSDFIESLLSPTSDARIFEIVTYAILRYYYHDQVVYFGFEIDNIQEENLVLYKTGRTNANDGGIDFVMKPLGRFFQVTETLDVKKYFLDIDKVERYPISFVIKSSDTTEYLLSHLRKGAKKQYVIKAIVEKYMESIEEIINIPALMERFETAKSQGHLRDILTEIVEQSRLEFNVEE